MTHKVIRHGDPPTTCQHYIIDPETHCCTQCSEKMIRVKVEPEYIKSAPNLAACTNPACVEAVENNTYDDADPPAGCTNPNGVYVPGRAVDILVGATHTYECQRCADAGQITMGAVMVEHCGQHHTAYVSMKG